MEPRPTLDCQVCGEVLRELTPREAQMLAERPYELVVACPKHRDDLVDPAFA